MTLLHFYRMTISPTNIDLKSINALLAALIVFFMVSSQTTFAATADPTGAATMQVLGLLGGSPATSSSTTTSVATPTTASPVGLGSSTTPTTNTLAPTTSSGIGQATSLAPSVPTAPSATANAPAATISPQTPQFYDYSANVNSQVFGANLFTGAFTRAGATQFNPDYAVAIGDQIQMRLWGAFEYDSPLTVDPKGNIFVPHVGPVFVLGVHNQDLQPLVDSSIRRVFRANVYSYASLAAAQPVRVFVGGFVNRPGLYDGTSMDSLLHYLDQAGGIDLNRGTFLNVQVKRGNLIRATFNLYDFLLEGRMPLIQLADGDVIFVPAIQDTVTVLGLADNAKVFEFSDQSRGLEDIVRLAKPTSEATHVRITRSIGTTKDVEYYPLDKIGNINIDDGDQIEFTSDKKPGTISIRVEGEHLNTQQEFVVPYGTRLGTVMQQITYSDRADRTSLQLFRNSIIERQKLLLDATLKRMESSVLTARSGTAEESELRAAEAALMLQWVDRAKSIVPTGQVVLANGDNIKNLLLESGDVIRIPAIDNMVLVSGEVMFPNTVALDSHKDIEDYIQTAGGYSQDADTSRIVIAHRDGSFEDSSLNEGIFSSGPTIRPGDEILVLPKVEQKYRQIFKELATIMYQMGLGARILMKY